MPYQRADDILKAYLKDAIAAERTFETQLRGFAKDGKDGRIQHLFADHAEETRTQHERLARRLEEIGGRPSTAKSFLGHMLGMMPRTAQIGHDESERSTQDLIMAFAVENSEIAMYEALAVAAMAAGDSETEQLARRIQEEERVAAERVWRMLGPTARESVEKLTLQAA